MRAPRPREQWPEEEHRAAKPSHQASIRVVRVDARRPDPQRGCPDTFDLGADVEQQPRHHLDVADARHVGQHALLFSEEARRQQRQRGVLVAFHGHTAFQPVPPFDQ
jgi:hypothetical protein